MFDDKQELEQFLIGTLQDAFPGDLTAMYKDTQNQSREERLEEELCLLLETCAVFQTDAIKLQAVQHTGHSRNTHERPREEWGRELTRPVLHDHSPPVRVRGEAIGELCFGATVNCRLDHLHVILHEFVLSPTPP